MKKSDIQHNDLKAAEKQNICFYCKHFFCAKYHMLLCDGGLPQLGLLTSLMRNVKASDTCNKFELHKVYKQKHR